MFDSMPRTTAAQNIGIDHYGFVLRRQWYVVVVATIVGALFAWGYLLTVPPAATATTDVELNVIATNAFSSSRPPQSLIDPATESEIVHSSVVAAEAARALGDAQTAAQLRTGLETTTTSNGQVVHLSYTAPTAAEARAGADALAAAYLDYRGVRAQAQITDMIARIAQQLDGLQKQLSEARQAIDAADAANRDSVLARTSRDVVTKGIDRLVSERTDLSQIDTAGGVILNHAVANPVSDSPKPALTIAGGVLAGLVLGMILAFPINRFDGRFRSRREVERALGVPPLAALRRRPPEFPETSADARQGLAVVRERVLARLEPPASLAVIDDSSGSDEYGLPTTLALSFADAGVPARAVFVGVSDHDREVLAGRLGLIATTRAKQGPEVFRSSLHPSLEFCLLPAATEPAGASPELAAAVESATGMALVVTRSSASEADLVAALRLADGLVITLATGASTSKRLFALLRETTAVGTPFLGTIVTPRQRRSRRRPDVPLAAVVPVAEVS